MASSGKRLRAIQEQIEPGKAYAIDEALDVLKNASTPQVRSECSWLNRAA
jgi:ribosomal protein L1